MGVRGKFKSRYSERCMKTKYVGLTFSLALVVATLVGCGQKADTAATDVKDKVLR